jgi:hypothetical protein
VALRSILLKITGDPTDAKNALRETVTELKKVDGLEAQARVTLKDEAIKAQIEVVKARLERLGNQTVTPKVTIAMARSLEQLERLEAKLAKLDGKDVTVDVNVDRKGALTGIVGAVGGAAGFIGAAVSGVGAFVSAATAGIPAVAKLVELAAGLGPALIVVLPIMGALIASFAAAAAGAAALGVALAGAFGPVALVAVVAIAKLVSALKAVKKDSAAAASSGATLASAQDGVKSSTEGLASAQANLREQTTSAYRAWQDAIEAVKDDLLGVESAQRGIEDANLNLRDAQQALKDFRGEAGLAGKAFGAIFDKFTDVAVDTSGLRGAITHAAAQSGVSLSGSDELELEHRIQAVRDAKTAEKIATDRLHDSNVALKRDRSTEADFAKRGIAAYGPYRQAVLGVTQAQRSLAASTRQLAQAQKASAGGEDAPKGPLAALIASIDHIKAKISAAFGPALDAIFAGASKGLDEFSKSFSDKRIVKALTDIGVAIGGVFVTFGKLFANKEFRDGFVKLAEGGAQLVKVIGSRIFADFATLMLRLAVAALPDLLGLFNKLADKLHAFVQGTRDGEAFRQKIHHLIESTKTWGNRIGEIVKFLAAVVDGLNSVFRFGKRALKLLNDLVFGDAASKFGENIGKAMTGWVNGAVRDIAGFVTRVLGKLGSLVDSAGKIGARIGRGLVHGIGAGLNALASIGRIIANGLIDAVNFAIHTINHGLPDKINLPGLPDINLPNNPIPEIPHLADGGIALRSILANIGERGREAILPLRADVLRQLGLAIHTASAPAIRGLQPVMAGTGTGGFGTHIDHFHTHVDAPAGELPDVQTTVSAISRLAERRFGGDVRQD